MHAAPDRSIRGKNKEAEKPLHKKDLKRYMWVIARIDGWKGYESKRNPGITTLWIGVRNFKFIIQGWMVQRNVSKR